MVKCIERWQQGSIQGRRTFTVEEREPRNSTVAESEILISNKDSVKGWVGY